MDNNRLRVITADITRQKVDAIVKAANSSLLGGGGVDGAIHDAAGPGLLAECKTLNGCKVGEAKATSGYDLPAKHIIHTVGPVYGRHAGQEARMLSSCYAESLALADELGAHSVAFPGISTGVYGYPKAKAASIAVDSIRNYFRSHQDSQVGDVLLVAYSEPDAEILSAAL